MSERLLPQEATASLPKEAVPQVPEAPEAPKKSWLKSRFLRGLLLGVLTTIGADQGAPRLDTKKAVPTLSDNDSMDVVQIKRELTPSGEFAARKEPAKGLKELEGDKAKELDLFNFVQAGGELPEVRAFGTSLNQTNLHTMRTGFDAFLNQMVEKYDLAGYDLNDMFVGAMVNMDSWPEVINDEEDFWKIFNSAQQFAERTTDEEDKKFILFVASSNLYSRSKQSKGDIAIHISNNENLNSLKNVETALIYGGSPYKIDTSRATPIIVSNETLPTILNELTSKDGVQQARYPDFILENYFKLLKFDGVDFPVQMTPANKDEVVTAAKLLRETVVQAGCKPEVFPFDRVYLEQVALKGWPEMDMLDTEDFLKSLREWIRADFSINSDREYQDDRKRFALTKKWIASTNFKNTPPIVF